MMLAVVGGVGGVEAAPSPPKVEAYLAVVQWFDTKTGEPFGDVERSFWDTSYMELNDVLQFYEMCNRKERELGSALRQDVIKVLPLVAKDPQGYTFASKEVIPHRS